MFPNSFHSLSLSCVSFLFIHFSLFLSVSSLHLSICKNPSPPFLSCFSLVICWFQPLHITQNIASANKVCFVQLFWQLCESCHVRSYEDYQELLQTMKEVFGKYSMCMSNYSWLYFSVNESLIRINIIIATHKRHGQCFCSHVVTAGLSRTVFWHCWLWLWFQKYVKIKLFCFRKCIWHRGWMQKMYVSGCKCVLMYLSKPYKWDKKFQKWNL